MIRVVKRWEATCDTCGRRFAYGPEFATLALLHVEIRRYGWTYKRHIVTCPDHPPQA